MREFLRTRSVVEIMVVAFTLLISAVVLVAGVAIAVVEILDPSSDTSAALQALTSVIAAILGALLGLLAGRAELVQRRVEEAEEVES